MWFGLGIPQGFIALGKLARRPLREFQGPSTNRLKLWKKLKSLSTRNMKTTKEPQEKKKPFNRTRAKKIW